MGIPAVAQATVSERTTTNTFSLKGAISYYRKGKKKERKLKQCLVSHRNIPKKKDRNYSHLYRIPLKVSNILSSPPKNVTKHKAFTKEKV